MTLQKQGVPFDLQTHKDKVPGLAAEADNFMKQDIEELVRENNGQDIEIEFYHGQRKLPLTTSLFEISSATRKPGLADPLSGDFVGFLASLADSGSPFGDAITIHFCIKDKPKPQTLRKESLSEYASIRQRTKSEAIEDISPASLNELV